MAISATSRQSRFHTETLETGSSDIDLKGVNLSLGTLELLVDAHLHLFSGVHYGLMGRNGVGKSTLLKAIGRDLLVGLPRNIRALYVDQLEGVDSQCSPLDIVLKADKEAMQARQEADLLQKAVEGGGGKDIARAVRSVQLAQLESELADAQRQATLRSGARGAEARKRLVALEARVAEARERVTGDKSNVFDLAELASAPVQAQELLEERFTQLNLSDAESAEARARKILKGLGFSDERQVEPFGVLSGGWRIRVALAQALFLEPELLLLDEPTNHLDLPAILWLATYLNTLETTTVVTVSHDRSFLNDVAEEIIVFKDKSLSYHKGNYDEYEENTEEKRVHMLKMKESVDRKREHIVKSINEGVRMAKKSGDDKRLSMAASRKKKLERLGMERNEDGHRFKLNRDRGGYHSSLREEIVVEGAEASVRWKLPTPSELRHAGPLLEVEAASVSYSRGAKPVLRNVTLNVGQGARVAVIGANGEGKSTLMKLIVGQLEPSIGSVRRHPQAVLGFFMQNHVDDLIAKRPDTSALAMLAEKHPGVKEQELRAHLGSFGIKGQLATQSVGTLSGGQAVRVAMAATLYSSPHLLILDEPTNHLDMNTISAMIEALQKYEGTVVVVSHDQHLVNSLGEVVYLVERGTVKCLEGGMEQYKRKVLKRMGAQR